MGGQRITIEDLVAFRWIADAQVSPDGRTVAYTEEAIGQTAGGDGPTHTYRSALWLVDTDGGAPRQFTTGEARDRHPRWSPDGTQLLFTSDRGTPPGTKGPRPKHLWVIASHGGEARRLTRAEHQPADATWSPDGAQVAFTGKAPPGEAPASDVRVITRLKYKFDGEGFWDGRYKHILVVPAEGGDARQLTSGDFDHREPAWSPDGKKIAFVANRSTNADYTNAADIYVLGVESGEIRRLTTSAGPVLAPVWSPDGSTIAYLGHENACQSASNLTLWVVPADGSAPSRSLTRHFDRTLSHHIISDMRSHPAVGHPVWSQDGRSIFVLVADGGRTALASVDVGAGTVRLMTSRRREIYGESYDAARRLVVMATSDPTNIGDLWVAPVEGFEAREPFVSFTRERRLTRVNAELLDRVELSKPVRYASVGADGWTIEGWVMPPVGYEPGQQYPVILQIHGGPHAAYGEAFFHEFQVLAALGYAVVFTNPRGSQGYGQAFTSATHNDWGGRDYQDIIAGLDAALARYSFLDPDRLGVAGGSYGGYMTNWIVGHTTRFKAAVTMRSIANCLSQWGMSDLAYFKGGWEFPGDPWESAEFYWQRSPLAHVHNVTTPLLILHSENDLRCPIGEGEQLFIALKKQGKTATFVRFPNESHELSRSGQPQHRLERLRLIVDWFKTYIPPTPRPIAAAPRRDLAGVPGDGAGA